MFSFATFLYLHNDKLLDVCTFQSAKKIFDIERDFSVSALDWGDLYRQQYRPTMGFSVSAFKLEYKQKLP